VILFDYQVYENNENKMIYYKITFVTNSGSQIAVIQNIDNRNFKKAISKGRYK